jgi:hypothetical protein
MQQKNSKKPGWSIRLLLMGISLVYLFGLLGCTPNSFEPLAESVDAVPGYPGPVQRTVENDLRYYEEILEREDLTTEERLRVESLLSETQRVATMVAAPAPSKEILETTFSEHETRVAQYVPQPTAPLQLGILGSGTFFEVHVPRQVEIENIWQGYVSGDLTRIYAGKLKPDYRISTSGPEEKVTEHGAVYVMRFLTGGEVETGLYITEQETGALRIQAVTDDYLELVSAGTSLTSSKTYYLGLNIVQLVDSVEKLQTSPIPTPTLNPSGYP